MRHTDSPRVLLMVNLSESTAPALDSECIKVRLSASFKPVNCTCNLFPSKCGKLSFFTESSKGSWTAEQVVLQIQPECLWNPALTCPLSARGSLFCKTLGDLDKLRPDGQGPSGIVQVDMVLWLFFFLVQSIFKASLSKKVVIRLILIWKM